ncbi:MAG: DUF402 domain-containing protein [Chloroflexi bacterium]|nr:DUF402 domain-containing protein [Chloroflexota bacterium]MDA1145008.1 DUF402 domain-containing protein [Chloroflexota bacterium]
MTETLKRWEPGETVVVRYLARDHDVIASGYPMICVEDTDERLVLFFRHGTPYLGFPHLPTEGRADGVGRRVAAPPRPRRERGPLVWQNTMLRFFTPGRAFQVWAVWREGSWQFSHWYVNLEAPFVRTAVGIDTRDHTLDIVASPDLDWHWKDEDEAAARVEHGIDSAAFAAAVRAEGERVTALIEGRAQPFGGDWPSWRPDPSWGVPELPEWWSDVPAADIDRSGGGER